MPSRSMTQHGRHGQSQCARPGDVADRSACRDGGCARGLVIIVGDAEARRERIARIGGHSEG